MKRDFIKPAKLSSTLETRSETIASPSVVMNASTLATKEEVLVNSSIVMNVSPAIIKFNDERKKNWQAAAVANVTGLFVLPYTSNTTTDTPVATNKEMQGPNLSAGIDISTFFPNENFGHFINKLNLFRDIYEDKNRASGYFYYLPKNYNLKWKRETSEYSFYIYYLSADADGRGKVIITAELTPNINKDDIFLTEVLLGKQLNKEVRFRPLPLRDTPKISFGNSLANFDVSDESVSTNVPTDFLEPIIVSWRMERRVDDLAGAMMNNIGITGNIEFLPHGDEDKIISVPVKLRVNDIQTFGNMEYTQASTFLNGFQNPLDYPVLLKQLIVMREKTDDEITIETLPLSDYEVEPQAIFASFSQNEKTSLLNGNIIKKLWVDYAIQSCDPCNDSVQSKITGGTSSSRVQNIEVNVLTPLEYAGASSLKLLIKSKQGDPKGKSDVLLPIVNIRQDNQTLSGGALFVSDGSQPNYQYQIVLIKPDGATLMSEWMPSENLFIVVGENTIRDNFETKDKAETQAKAGG